MKQSLKLFSILALGVLLISGCGKKANSQKPIEQIRTEVEKMSVNDLQAEAKAYAEAIVAKKKDVQKVEAELKSIGVKELLSEKGKKIQGHISEIGAEVQALTERYQVYAQKYRELGGDLSKIQINA